MANTHRIGVVSANPLQRHVIQNVLSNHGLEITVICDPVRLDDQPKERVNAVQCWILDLPDDDQEYQTIDALFDSDSLPVLYGLEPAPEKSNEAYPSWERRLVGKLEDFLQDIKFDADELGLTEVTHQERTLSTPSAVPARLGPKPIRQDKTVADSVWILAASTGGPEAVKSFLDRIPVDIKAAFLYAQHIDEHFSEVLSQVLGRHGELPIKAMQEGDQLYEGEVRMVPVNQEVSFQEDGIHLQNKAWPGPYGPSINKVLENMLAHYGNRCHVIIFSGMGDDGTTAAKKMKQAGCKVWAQSLDSCANAAMPQSVIDANCSELSADPATLADRLVRIVGTRRPKPAAH